MKEREEEHFVGLVAQKALIEREGKVLFIKNKNDDRWDFPGGRLNINEFPETGLTRELKEEIGCDVTVGKVIYTNQYFHGAAQKPCLFINYAVQLKGGAKITLAEDELSKYAWLLPEQIQPEKTFPNCSETLKIFFTEV